MDTYQIVSIISVIAAVVMGCWSTSRKIDEVNKSLDRLNEAWRFETSAGHPGSIDKGTTR